MRISWMHFISCPFSNSLWSYQLSRLLYGHLNPCCYTHTQWHGTACTKSHHLSTTHNVYRSVCSRWQYWVKMNIPRIFWIGIPLRCYLYILRYDLFENHKVTKTTWNCWLLLSDDHHEVSRTVQFIEHLISSLSESNAAVGMVLLLLLIFVEQWYQYHVFKIKNNETVLMSFCFIPLDLFWHGG